MKKYELLLVLPGTLDEKEAEVKSGEILNLVKAVSSDAELNVLGKNRLAYPVKQIRYGYFYTIIFSAEAADLKIVQGKIGLMRDILRGIISLHNSKWSANQKISYSTNEVGVTTMMQDSEKTKPAEEAKKVDLKEIDKKLDEILDGSIIAGV